MKPSEIFNEVHIERLNRLADYLEALPDGYKNFNLEDFCHEKGYNFYNVHPSEVESKINECGTVACAIGHCPVALKEVSTNFNGWIEYTKELFGWSLNGFPKGNVLFDDVYKVSHYARHIMCYMFSSHWTEFYNERTPKGTAKRIRQVTKNHLTVQQIIDILVVTGL